MREAAIEEFTSGRVVRRVFIVYNEFKSVMQQRVVTEQLLPIPQRRGADAGRARTADSATVGGDIDYIYEPEPAQIFGELLPKHVEIQVYRALLESAAAEHAARMTAMDAATKNSGEIIDSLTLYMNKVRQAAITREIIEVVSGAQARRRQPEPRAWAEPFGRRNMATEVATKQKVGKVVQVIGPVVDIEFADGHLPDIYNAVHIVSDGTAAARRSTSSARWSSTSARTACAPSR